MYHHILQVKLEAIRMTEKGIEKVEKYLAAIPVSARGIVTRAMGKTGGRMNAIKAKCLDCCHFNREEVRLCATVTCPLNPWRPFQKAKDENNEQA